MSDLYDDMQDDSLSLSIAVHNAINNKNADTKVQRVIDSWADDAVMQNQVSLIIGGCETNNIKTGRRAGTGKITFSFTGVTRKKDKENFDKPFGYWGALPSRDVDVPVEWLSADVLPFLFSDDSNDLTMNRIKFWRRQWIDGGWEYFPQKSLNGSAGASMWLIKLFLMGQSASSRKTWNSLFESMKVNDGYVANCLAKTGDVAIDSPAMHFGFCSEEKVAKGMYNRIRSTSVFGVPAKNGYVLCEEPKKANARETKLYKQGDSIALGKKVHFVAADIPQPIKDRFVAGQVFNNDLIAQIGAARIKGALGLKGVTMPFPNGWSDQFKPGTILCSKNSFKSARNGVAKVLLGCSYKDLTKKSRKEVNAELAGYMTTVELDGYPVSGWYVSAEVSVSNMYALYGIRTVEDTDVDEDWYEDFSDTNEKAGSFYTEQSDLLRANSDHNIITDLKIALDEGIIRHAPNSINIKMQEVNNIYWSHGIAAAQKALEAIIDASISRLRETTKFALDILSDVTYDIVEYSEEDFNNIWKKIYPSGTTVSVGSLDPDAFSDVDFGNKAIKYLLNGDGGKWDGLFGKTNKLFVVNGKEFLIPGGDVVEEFTHAEDGTDRWFTTGPAQAFQMLIIAKKTYETVWSLKEVNHNMDLQRDLFGKALDGFNVEGFGNKVILPAWWLRHDVVACIDPSLSKHDGDIVMGSKMPVIFDGAMDGFIYRSSIPTSIFGELDARMTLALRNVVFINIPTLLYLRNDADGDMHRIMFLDCLPLRKQAPPVHAKQWVNTYSNDEYDLELKYKEYKLFSNTEVHKGIVEAAENKAYVGVGTNDLNMFGHFLQLFVGKGWMKYIDAKVLRGYYAFGLQDYVVGGIKHKSGNTSLNLFKLGNLKDCLMLDDGEDKMTKELSRGYLTMMIANYSKDSVDAVTSLNKFFEVWDVFSGLSAVGYTPLASRRVNDITKHDYTVISNEHHMKELDVFTASAVNNFSSSQPTHGMKKNYKLEEAFDKCMDNLDSYKNKYLVFGQDDKQLPFHQDTMIGRLRTYWKEVSEQAYVDSKK